MHFLQFVIWVQFVIHKILMVWLTATIEIYKEIYTCDGILNCQPHLGSYSYHHTSIGGGEWKYVELRLERGEKEGKKFFCKCKLLKGCMPSS